MSNTHDVTDRLYSQHGLRGIAALMVAIYHGRTVINENVADIDAHTGLISNQYLAVDLFFIMSGFILCHVYEKGLLDNFRGRLIQFWIARVSRLLPLFYFTLGAYLFVYFILINIGVIDSVIVRENSKYIFISNLLLIHSWGLHDNLGWNYPSWSISTEMAAYLAFPVLILIKNALRIWSSIIFIGLGGLFYTFLEWGFGNLNITFDFGVLRCFAGFLIGIGLFGLTQNAAKARTFLIWCHFDIISVICLLAALHFRLDDRTVIAAFSVLIFTTSADEGTIPKFLKIRVFQRLGDISYSIYLNHAVILLAVSPIFKLIFADDAGHLTPVAAVFQFTVFLGLTIGCSILTYRLLEIPSGRSLKRKLQGISKRRGALSLGLNKY